MYDSDPVVGCAALTERRTIRLPLDPVLAKLYDYVYSQIELHQRNSKCLDRRTTSRDQFGQGWEAR
jgi:hypothetical protein